MRTKGLLALIIAAGAGILAVTSARAPRPPAPPPGPEAQAGPGGYAPAPAPPPDPGPRALPFGAEPGTGEDTGPGTLRGRVVDELGAPMDGVRIEVSMCRALTGADGTFEVRGLPAGDAWVSAEAQGYERAGDPVSVAVTGITELPEPLVLEGRAGLGGRCFSAGGSPLPSAIAIAKRTGEAGEPAGALSDDGGRYWIPDLPAGEWTVRLYHAHWLVVQLPPAVHPDGGRTLLPDAVLPPGGAIAGRVTDPDGLPIPDAWVHVPRIPELEQDWPGIRNVEAGGRFLIPGLPDGEHDLCAGAPGFLPAREPRLRVHGTETVEVAIRLVPGGTISGRVVDESARPIAGAVLEPEMPHDTPASPGIPSAVWAFALRRTPPAETATDGTFTLRGLLGDPAAILVSVPGSREQRFAAVPRGTTDHLLQFLRDGSLSGIVVDAETGRPPGSLDVRLDQGSVWFEPETGRLTGKWIPPGRRTLAVNAGGYLPVRSEIEVEPGRETEDVIVRLSPGQRLRVAVRRATDGAPVPDAAVRAESEGGSAAADTGEDGCCELRGLPAGPCDLTVTAVGLAPAEVSDVDVPAAEALRVVLSPGGTITGTAFDAEGKPLGDVRVDLARFAGDWVRWTVRTDADGRFRFELLTPRRYVVSLRESGSSTVMEEVEVADGAEVDIALHNGEQEGRVRFNGRLLLRGVPQPDRWFRVSSPEPGSSTAQGRTDDEGRFALAGLVPGRYRLWSDVDVPVDLRGGGTIERDIELPAGRLRGRVTAADRCTPVEGASVSLTSGDGLAACTARTDAGGWFAIGPARPGTVRLVATADGYAPQVLEGVEVTEEGGEVSVALSRGFSVTLVVTGTDGRPVRRAWAYIPNLPVCFHWPIGADGRGEARLPPGRHTIRVTARGCAPAVLDLAIGGDVEVPVALTAGGSLVVKVVDGDRPATGAHVRLAETDHETSWVPAGADGTVRFEHLAAGAVRIEAAGAAGLAVEAEAKIEEGAEAAVTLTLGRR